MQCNRRRAAAPIILATLFIFTACQEPTSVTAAAHGAPRLASKTSTDIHVATVDSLYSAINNPVNAGRRIVIEASTTAYMLDPSPTRPHGGRLELLRDMTLAGATGRPEDVVIDASAMTLKSLTDGQLTGAVRAGRGDNAIEGLTVQNASKGAAAIETDLVDGLNPHVRIENVVVTGNQRGLDIRNPAQHRVLEVELIGNEMRDNTTLPQGQGVRFVNTGADNATIRVTMKRNNSHGNLLGCLAANLNSSHSVIEIDSREDRFTDNRSGCAFLGGNAAPSPVILAPLADNNSITFTAHASWFADDNSGAGAGISIQGGTSVAPGSASYNSVTLDLWGAKMGNNGVFDITGWGAFSATHLAGTYNVVTVAVHGQPVTPNMIPSTPYEAAMTNRATITP
jgi:hypothetical protein